MQYNNRAGAENYKDIKLCFIIRIMLNVRYRAINIPRFLRFLGRGYLRRGSFRTCPPSFYDIWRISLFLRTFADIIRYPNKMAKVHQSLKITAKKALNAGYYLLRLRPVDGVLPAGIQPGQFVEIKTPENASLLRRPISIHFVDYRLNELSLLVRAVGAGTEAICAVNEGGVLDLVLPLGNGFTCDFDKESTVVLVGGGVGVAPLLYQAAGLADKGLKVKMVYGARTSGELVVADAFEPYCDVEITTDDGSAGLRGRVTDSLTFREGLREAAMVQCCGPAPMMKAVAAVCREAGIPCEVSLENMMACGLGACLCCVEKTVKGNVCVCTDGPVFNIKELIW